MKIFKQKWTLILFLAILSAPMLTCKKMEEALGDKFDIRKFHTAVLAEKSLPVVFTPAVIRGGTGPVTIAGGLIQGNAEILAGYVLTNLINEVTPFIYGGGVVAMDMSLGILSYTSPEFMLATSALTDMARYYKLPMFSFAGFQN